MNLAPTDEIHRYVVVRGPQALGKSAPNSMFELPISEAMFKALDESGSSGALKVNSSARSSERVSEIHPIMNAFEESYIAAGDLFEIAFQEALDLLGFESPEDIENDLSSLSDGFLQDMLESDFPSASITSETIKFLYALFVFSKEKSDAKHYMSGDIVIPKMIKKFLEAEAEETSGYDPTSLVESSKRLILIASVIQVIDRSIVQIVSSGPINEEPAEAEEIEEAPLQSPAAFVPTLELLLPYLRDEQLGVFPKDMIENPDGVDLFQLRETLADQVAKIVLSTTSAQTKADPVAFSEYVDASVNKYLVAGFSLDDLVKGFTGSPLVTPKTPVPGDTIKPVGIADLKLVEQKLQKYDFGELAHIENVLAGEKRSREHAVLDRVEQSFTFEEEETKSKEKNLQSTERAELSSEIDTIRKESSNTKFGIDVSAKYGVVSVKTNAGFQSSSSSEQQAKTARKLTRETIQKASERLSRRVRKERTITNIFELRETNIHAFEADKTKNIVGQYRWVEKHYWSQVRNYGARLMFAFDIPEPAAQYLWAVSGKPSSDGVVRPPEEPNFNAAQINESNYLALAKRYGATVPAPPPAQRFMQVAGRANGDQSESPITISEGYECTYAIPSASFYSTTSNSSVTFVVGWEQSRVYFDGRRPRTMVFNPPLRGSVAYKVQPFNTTSGNFISGLGMALRRTNENYEAWKISVYNAIYQSYQEQLADFERKTARQEAAQGGVIAARTDREYRDIEKMELRRGSIELLTDQKYQSFNATKLDPSTKRPIFDNAEARQEADTVRFIEGSFEWDQITYEFHPYFWGRIDTWSAKITNTNNDPVFSRFLRAGFARVIVPVERHKERDVLYYLETGKIWAANEPPIISNPLYLALLAEIDAIEDLPGDKEGVPEGEPWKQIVPTNLVVLDDGEVELPSWDVSPDGNQLPFLPSEITCRGKPYNKAQWSDSMFEAASAFKRLGYGVPELGEDEAIAYFRSNPGKRVVKAFQIRSNEIDIPTTTGSTLAADGRLGPCTLRALTVAIELLDAEEWPGPV